MVTGGRLIAGAVVLLGILGLLEHRQRIRAWLMLLLHRIGLSASKPVTNSTKQDQDLPPDHPFSAAAAHARSASFRAAANPSNETQAALYGLFKQATLGDVESPEPSKLFLLEHTKWAVISPLP